MQVCLIYFQSCVIKCRGEVWLNGTTVHYVLFNREFGMFNLEWLAQYPLLINLMTHSALLFEFAVAFWLWFRPTRRWAILGGILLHMGIWPVINVPGFGEMMIATYITFLLPTSSMASCAGSTRAGLSLDLPRSSRQPTSGPPVARYHCRHSRNLKAAKPWPAEAASARGQSNDRGVFLGNYVISRSSGGTFSGLSSRSSQYPIPAVPKRSDGFGPPPGSPVGQSPCSE